jgi:hypothetical protein
MDQHLHSACAFVDEEIGMTSPRFTEHAHHAREGGVDARSHVQRFHCEPGRIDPDHFNSSRSQSAHSGIADAGHRTLTVSAPRRTSIWIGELSRTAVTIGSATNDFPGEGSTFGPAAAFSPRSPCTAHLRSRLALIE